MKERPLHTFHIPVLGLGYSIDTPIKVAKYGISSVISIIEDELVEDMREYHSAKNSISYTRIHKNEEDSRSRRITAYLNMMQDIIASQMKELKVGSFEGSADLAKYFEMLPSDSALRQRYIEVTNMVDSEAKWTLQNELKKAITRGSIDVNIMAKIDNANYNSKGEKLADEYSDALSALRGYANSTLKSSLVLSAGYNPKLYSYIEHFEDFFPDENGDIKKRITLKVSDHRSAHIQGKILAKKGLWVSEFRVESGLNCGGHAFPTEGVLLGPILEEFKVNRQLLKEELFSIYTDALKRKGKLNCQYDLSQKITVQGGVGTAEEHSFLLDHFELDSVGWGSPFLLVPEATNVDSETLQALSTAKKEDYFLSYASPLGVPFNNFKKSSSENQRLLRVNKGRPGSPCYKKYLSSNTEFTEIPICTASRQYQRLKEKEIMISDRSEKDKREQLEEVHAKDCLCEGLGTPARLKNGMALPHKLSAVTVCPGPNLAYFSGIFSLKEIVDHIYGRNNILNGEARSHMFINELRLYIDYLKSGLKRSTTQEKGRNWKKFIENIAMGISFYRNQLRILGLSSEVYTELNIIELQLSTMNV